MAKEYIEKARFDHTLLLLGYAEKDLPRRALEQQAKADVAPVVHGWWEHLDRDVYNCTNCGGIHRVETCMGVPKWEYCPNCGAKMDQERLPMADK